MERLQKLLARSGVASRRAAERLISEGRVTVNGEVVTRLGTRVDASRDAVKVDGRRVSAARGPHTYVMLHKPAGYMTTMSDPEGRPTVLDLVRGVRGRIFPVGRLDFNSEGLLLMTDDGALARDLMHPGSGVPKTYRVKVRGQPDPTALRRIERGPLIHGRKALPARVKVVRPGNNAWVEVTVQEGRKHHVRLLLRAAGHPVMRLRRVAYGGVVLGDLPSGRFRHLTAAEIERLRQATRGAIGASGGPSGRPLRRSRDP